MYFPQNHSHPHQQLPPSLPHPPAQHLHPITSRPPPQFFSYDPLLSLLLYFFFMTLTIHFVSLLFTFLHLYHLFFVFLPYYHHYIYPLLSSFSSSFCHHFSHHQLFDHSFLHLLNMVPHQFRFLYPCFPNFFQLQPCRLLPPQATLLCFSHMLSYHPLFSITCSHIIWVFFPQYFHPLCSHFRWPTQILTFLQL